MSKLIDELPSLRNMKISIQVSNDESTNIIKLEYITKFSHLCKKWKQFSLFSIHYMTSLHNRNHYMTPQ